MTDDGNRVDLDKHAGDPAQPNPEQPLDFDPYRFGVPEHPVPPEFAPPGYRAPVPPAPAQPPASPYGSPPAPGPYGGYQGGGYPGQGYPGQGYNAYYGHPGRYGHGPTPTVGKTGRGKAIAALVLGIASIVLFWLWIFDAVVVVLAVVFGLIALAESRNRPATADPRRDGERSSARTMAVIGLVCALVGAIIVVIVTVKFVHAANDCGGLGKAGQSGFQQCVEDHL